jgi:hypothetical protein
MRVKGRGIVDDAECRHVGGQHVEEMSRDFVNDGEVWRIERRRLREVVNVAK